MPKILGEFFYYADEKQSANGNPQITGDVVLELDDDGKRLNIAFDHSSGRYSLLVDAKELAVAIVSAVAYEE